MAYGGGTWTVQNKILPGSYINFISVGTANTFNERGYGAAVPANLKYVKFLEMEITKEDFYNKCKEYFNVKATDYSLWWVREFFVKGKSLVIVPITSSAEGYKKFVISSGETIIGRTTGYYSYSPEFNTSVKANIDDETKFDVVITMDDEKIIELIGINELSPKYSNEYIEFTAKTVLSEEIKLKLEYETDSTGTNIIYKIDETEAVTSLKNMLLTACSFLMV